MVQRVLSNSQQTRQARFRGALDTALLYLGLEDRFSLSTLLGTLEFFRHRSICLQAYPHLPLPYTGLAIVKPTIDIICYRANLSETLTNQIICHELIHLLRGHRGDASSNVVTPTISAGNQDHLQIHWCGTYNDELEAEVEYSGTYLASKLSPVRTWSEQEIIADYASCAPLHSHLRRFASSVYLENELPLPAVGERPDHLALARMVVEITDARRLFYAGTSNIGTTSSMPGRIDLAHPTSNMLAMVASWEARLLHSSCHGKPFESVPAELSTATYQSLEYYRLLAAALQSSAR